METQPTPSLRQVSWGRSIHRVAITHSPQTLTLLPGETPCHPSCYFEILHRKAISERASPPGLLGRQVYVIVFIFGTSCQPVRASLEQRASGRWMSESRSSAARHGHHWTSR